MKSETETSRAELISELKEIHLNLRVLILRQFEETNEELHQVISEKGGDFQFRLDETVEDYLEEQLIKLSSKISFKVIREGNDGEKFYLKKGDVSPEFTIIIDPIDGTRGLMFQKRQGFILTGIGPAKAKSLADLDAAIMTEIPLIKQYLADTFLIDQHGKLIGERHNMVSGEIKAIYPNPSRNGCLNHTFGTVCRYISQEKSSLNRLEEQLYLYLKENETDDFVIYEDQYICSAGQFYNTFMGQDLWVADIRPYATENKSCAKPYDLCTEIIGRKAGIIICDLNGNNLNSPLDVSTPVSWFGFANEKVQDRILPIFQKLITDY